jgi:hypothetical protein
MNLPGCPKEAHRLVASSAEADELVMVVPDVGVGVGQCDIVSHVERRSVDDGQDEPIRDREVGGIRWRGSEGPRRLCHACRRWRSLHLDGRSGWGARIPGRSQWPWE